MNGRHAYLIMAHNDFELLAEILKGLDHERNDIFLHMDKKTGDYPQDCMRKAVIRGKLYFVPRLCVNWGGYSQIRCELHLMKQAIEKGPHEYYHMMTGATAALMPQDEILKFFDAHSRTEFIGFDNTKDYSGRAQRYNLFNEIGKADTKQKELKAFIRNKCRGIQNRFNYIYGPARGIQFKKGFVYWSLTEGAVHYILSEKETIQRVYRHSFCGDELFVQTLIYNSPFVDMVYDLQDEYRSCLRYVKSVQSWKKGYSGGSALQTALPETGITEEDMPEVLKSGRLFGFKFVGEAGMKALRELRIKREEISR